MTVLVVGSGGCSGIPWWPGASSNPSTWSTYHSTAPAFDIPLEQHDIRETDVFRTILDDYQPDTLVNCAAMTDVDGCESDRETAFAVNGLSPVKLPVVVQRAVFRFVHASTEYVFDGDESKPYDETTLTDPIQVYGESNWLEKKPFRMSTATYAGCTVLVRVRGSR